MARIQTVAGIDIGTSVIKVLVAKKDTETGKITEVLSLKTIDSAGVQKGRIKTPEETAKKIAEVFTQLSEERIPRPREFYVSLNGNKLELTSSRGLVSVGRADGKVSQEDIERAHQGANATNLQSTNKEVLKTFAKEWILDGEREIKDPLKLKGTRLELEAFLLSGFVADTENIIEAIAESGIDSEVSIVPAILADINSILTSAQKELGVALVSIGAGTSSVAVFEDGRLLNLAVFPVGAANITNDIAIGFKTEIEIAEKIKRDYGSCSKTGIKKLEIDLDSFSGEKIQIEKSKKVKNKNSLCFSEKELNKIIDARVCEIFDLIDKEIKKVSKQGLLPGGIVLVGGGAKLPGIVDLAKKEFNLPCRVGYPKNISGIDKDCSLSTVCGLIADSEEDTQNNENVSRDGLWKKIKDFLKNLNP
ncbi:MAG: cell division protein FtsA [Candidatus Microsyncoccus archaeolyticus]|nr:MAG: cell division protein FtsA [Candidatus Parcubacteria bacterium]